ncbi:hypothetical protein OUZ56_000831 [Daphnia magna]|uniref:Uncharacterized protein n=1 Tax=Daphnia magna TaxID=35525 RepID=A0ABR0A1J1_9CRUS|nr:hypothetical protein OUZ56_000831 [Daphnia magna]
MPRPAGYDTTGLTFLTDVGRSRVKEKRHLFPSRTNQDAITFDKASEIINNYEMLISYLQLEIHLTKRKIQRLRKHKPEKFREKNMPDSDSKLIQIHL